MKICREPFYHGVWQENIFLPSLLNINIPTNITPHCSKWRLAVKSKLFDHKNNGDRLKPFSRKHSPFRENISIRVQSYEHFKSLDKEINVKASGRISLN